MSIFTRRHYQAIAEVIADTKISHFNEGLFAIQEVTEDFCDMFSRDNPNFNREKFLKACGMEGE